MGFAGLPESGASVPPSVLTGGASAMLRGNRAQGHTVTFLASSLVVGYGE